MKEKNTGGRITALLSLSLKLAIFPEPKDGNLRRWGFKGTSERLSSITLVDRAYSGFLFGISFCIFPPNPYGIRIFQLKRRAVRPVYFRDFYRDFMGLPGFCGGNGDMVRRTVSYANTVLQAHVQTKASAAT